MEGEGENVWEDWGGFLLHNSLLYFLIRITLFLEEKALLNFFSAESLLQYIEERD